MKRIWIRWGVTVIVFFIAIAVFNVVLNQGTTSMTIDMQGATLPVVSVLFGEDEVNTMHGYVNDMDMGAMRDSITPIDDLRTIRYKINAFNTDISQIKYEVRSKDGSRLIENGDLEDYEKKYSDITGSIIVKDLIEKDKEYNLKFILKLADGRDVNYYTRLLWKEDSLIARKIGFVKEFNQKTFDKEDAKELSVYMETNSEGNNSSFGKVNIHSSIDQLSFGNMSPSRVGSIKTTICEIGDQTAQIKLEYLVTVRADDNVTNYYHVEEYYRIRNSSERFYLLSFDRTMNDIFAMEKSSVVNNKIVLGIRENETQLTESDDGSIIVFENEGRLFSYNITDNKLARLFAFYEDIDMDERNDYNRSKIKILRVEETGNVAFMVYGYMNRGIHEGEVGVMVGMYDSLLNTIEERVFIPYFKSPEILMTDIDKLSYLSADNVLCVMIDGRISAIRVDDLSIEEVASDIMEDTLFVSKSHKSAVWKERYESDSEIVYMDLAEDRKSLITNEDNEIITPIGFMNEDLIYGVSNENDIIHNSLGDSIYPMKKILIRSDAGRVLKDYQEDDMFIVSGTINNNQINLKRIRRYENGSYIEALDDQITNSETPEVVKNKETTVLTEKFETIKQIELKSKVDDKTVKFLTPRQVLNAGSTIVKVNSSDEKPRFYIYDMGHITGINDNPGKAVSAAFDVRGTVVDNKGDILYTRADTLVRNQIMAIKEESTTSIKNSLVICLDNILKHRGISRNTEMLLAKGDTPITILENNIPNAYVINLTGCKMDVVTYYLSQDIPVLAVLNNGNAYLLIGYNEQNIVWFDPTEGTIYKMGMNDSRTLLEDNGNQLLTYSLKEEN